MTPTTTNPKQRKHFTGVFAALILASMASASPLAAQEPAPADSWSVSVGLGAASTTTYPGSSERYVLPFPAFDASWSRGALSVSASMLNGLGVTYSQSSTGLTWNVSVLPGRERHRDGYSMFGARTAHSQEVRTLLQHSPNASTPVTATAMVAMPTPVGIFGAKAAYAPTRVTPAEPGSRREMRHGGQYSLVYLAGLPVSSRLTVAGTAQLKYMSAGYARAWYGVQRATPSLPAFSAEGGLHDTQVAMQLNYRLTERIGLAVLAAETWLLGDARKSPFTQAARSSDLAVQLLYRF